MMVRPTLLLVVFLIAFCAFGQTTSTVVGAVTDVTGAVVVGAEVKVVNAETAFVTKSVTTAEGAFYLPYLNPGPYRLTIQASGFKQYVREGIVLRTNETPRIDVTLELGNVNESISVSGTVPLLETETATAGHILDGSTVVKIPVLQKA